MAKKRAYRNVDPATAANTMLQNLIAKIPEMKTNYAKEMDRFAVDVVAQNAYAAGVQLWITSMRSKEVRDAIMNAVNVAKSKYKAAVEAAKAKIASLVKPITT